MKLFYAVILIVGLALVGYIINMQFFANPSVQQELLGNPGGERAGIVMLLTFPDGKQIPVNYLREGNLVFAGADGPWWRGLVDKNAQLNLLIKEEQLTGVARVVMDDPAYVADVFSRLRPKAPAWLPDWLNGRLVVITIDEG